MGMMLSAWLMAGGWLVGVSGESNRERFEFTRTEMAVPVFIVLYSDTAATATPAAEAAFDRIRELNAIFSDYDPESELLRLCDSSQPGKPVPVSDDLWRILHEAVDLSTKTEGAFDPTIGPVSRLWRRARRLKELPKEETLRTALNRVDYRSIRFHPDRQAVELLKPNMLLDLGGIAKGYAIEEAFKVLRRRGFDQVLIKAGGDIVLGKAPPQKPGWQIGIGQLDPQKPPRQYLWLSEVTLATSGDRNQFVEIGGKRYSHLIDPKTGRGLTDQSQVTVIVPQGTRADGLASSINILGPEKGLKMLEAYPRAAAFIIRTVNGKEEVLETSNWKDFPRADLPKELPSKDTPAKE